MLLSIINVADIHFITKKFLFQKTPRNYVITCFGRKVECTNQSKDAKTSYTQRQQVGVDAFRNGMDQRFFE